MTTTDPDEIPVDLDTPSSGPAAPLIDRPATTTPAPSPATTATAPSPPTTATAPSPPTTATAPSDADRTSPAARLPVPDFPSAFFARQHSLVLASARARTLADGSTADLSPAAIRARRLRVLVDAALDAPRRFDAPAPPAPLAPPTATGPAPSPLAPPTATVPPPTPSLLAPAATVPPPAAPMSLAGPASPATLTPPDAPDLIDELAVTALKPALVLPVPAPPPPTPSLPDDPPRFTAERTGRTGVFVSPHRLVGAALDDLPALDLPAHESGWQYVTVPRPHRLRRLFFTRALPVVALLLVIVWSYRQLARNGPRQAVQNPVDTLSGIDAPPPPPPPPPTPPPSPPSDDDDDDLPAVALARAEVLEFRDDPRVVSLPLRQVLHPRRVTVLNLWATWCAPCNTEFEHLKQLFAAQRAVWKDAVEFIPVQVDDTIDGGVARREYAGRMPPFTRFLADTGLSTGLKAALVQRDDIPRPLALPVTLILGCRGKVEKVHARPILTPEQQRDLLIDINKALGNLSRCAPPAPRPPDPPRPAPPSARCGARHCAPDETCARRPSDPAPTCIPKADAIDFEAP